MKADNGIFEKKSIKSIDEILAALNILKITTNILDFEKWLKAYHKKEINNEVVQGYKFFITTTIRLLVNAIELDHSLGLREDFIFFRGRFEGIPIEEIPNTSEKTIFVKNTWSLSKPLRKARDWEDVKVSVERLKPLAEVFEEIYENAVPTIKIKKDLALSAVTKFYTLIFLNDARRGIPYGYISTSTIKVSVSPEYLMKVFDGYALTLQYLWFKLLGEENFNKSCLKELHRASKIYSKKSEEYLEDLEERVKVKEWYALDMFFGRINEEIIKPLINKLDLNLGFEPLLVIENFNKNVLKPLLSKEGLQDPEYFKKKSKNDVKKWLDFKLLWYNVEVLSSTGSIFSGVPAFVSILVGSVNLSEDEVLVKIFKHPAEKGKYNYSYGILIPAFGSTGLTDYSGWLIFFDCATDYSGFGGSLYTQAKSFIDRFKENGAIEVEEIEVEEGVFQEYLKERSESSVFDRVVAQTSFGPSTVIDISKIEGEKRDFQEKVKGVLFELLVYKWVWEQGYYDEVKHNHIVNGEEIDVFSKKGNKIYLCECKVTIHKDKINKTLNQINRKIKALRSEYPEHSIVPIIITCSPLPAERRKFFEERGIKVKDGFNKEIENSGLFSKDKVKLVNQIFESQKLQNTDTGFD